ncbi:hypothetical protein OIU34_18575 [Pararhizobium sp. BT-229]|uniref:hypothetical protein n=1 Tax=Pararhizobium sp. BT-229 TaxID=2986923 RepID=UPI0021F7EDD8|nr:hypothetical protein [Pararhizobium sp. BT-229]MCV9963885.1 hypothetical protein [Pararhizobium sp. BT-229]
MTGWRGKIHYLSLQFIFGAMWLALIAGMFIAALVAMETLPFEEAKIARAILSLAGFLAMFRALLKLKVTADSQNAKYAPPVRDLFFSAAVILAVAIGNLESGGCWAYYGSDGTTQIVDCGYGLIVIDPNNQAF